MKLQKKNYMFKPISNVYIYMNRIKKKVWLDFHKRK